MDEKIETSAGKTVYVLGAGFSVEAGAPTQADIIRKAFELHQNDSTHFDQRFITFQDFLTKQLNITEDNLNNVELEDIFTPLDRCLSENCQFRGISLDSIMRVREAAFYVVGRTIQIILNNTNKEKDYIDSFAKNLVNLSSVRAGKRYRNQDPVSVISTNWDILLDNSIHKHIVEGSHNAVVDYCCYISSRDETDESIKPGLEKLGEGGFNVKLLKLHGSLNWRQCARCMRLYSRFNRKDAIQALNDNESCRHCDKNFPEENGKHILASNLIMPTFIKDLSNPQYKIIWQNAGIEISEAGRLVFIGYSLPSADFEMRQLLSRMTRKNAKIEVVDFCRNSDKQTTITNHWKRFFGDREILFHFEGAKNFINF